MNDPRINLKEKLIKVGFALNDVTIIALDAGSSQTIVYR